MIIGFHYHVPAIEKEDGGISMPGYLGVFIDSLANRCEEVICFMHSPLASEMNLMDYDLKSQNIKLVDIGPHISMMKRGLKAGQYAGRIVPFLPQIDIMLLRGPSPLLPAIAAACRKRDIPVSYLLVGDYLDGLNAAISMNAIKKSILWVYYAYNKYTQDKDIRKTLVLVNSTKLYNEYQLKTDSCVEVKTTTLTQKDFFKRADTCEGKTIELLYTGRIDPTKGIEDIIGAIDILRKKGIDNIRFNLVGWETSKGFLEKIRVLIKELGWIDNFIFHGKKTVGEELFQAYKDADIYVIASRGDFEGFPRTLWEAMANSMPIVATKAGSIPYFLTNEKEALLVESNSVQELANAIEKLIFTKDLRQKLIENGFALAQTNTLEIQSERMLQLMQQYLDGQKLDREKSLTYL